MIYDGAMQQADVKRSPHSTGQWLINWGIWLDATKLYEIAIVDGKPVVTEVK